MKTSLTNSRRMRTVAAGAAVAAGLGIAGLLGGTAVASAHPGSPCGYNCNGGGHDIGGRDFGGRHDFGGRGAGFIAPPPDRAWRGIEQGRFDHQPFNYGGQWVTPVYDPGYAAWGFWLGPVWIPL